MQDHNLKDLDNLHANVETFNIRRNVDSNMDEVVIHGRRFTQPDGSAPLELAVGAECEDFYHGSVPVIDVLKFALIHCEDLVARALRETGMTSDIRRIADDVDQAFDMESGQ
jgi:hypothetical protein